MPFSIDFLDDGRVLEWEATADGAVATERDDYTPRFYVASRDPDADLNLTALQSVYDQHPDVVATEMVGRRPGFRRDKEPVLAVDVGHIDRVTALAHEEIETYDASYYETQLVRAIESILAPLDWDRNDIRRELNGTHIVGITDWT